MEKTAEFYMLHELMEQVEYTCTALESFRDCISSPDELRKIETVLCDNQRVIEKTKVTLQSLQSNS